MESWLTHLLSSCQFFQPWVHMCFKFARLRESVLLLLALLPVIYVTLSLISLPSALGGNRVDHPAARKSAESR